MKATALIAGDEPRLREELTELPAQAWPELQMVALARNKTAAPAFPSGELLRQVVEEPRRNGRSSGPRWLRAQVGPALRMIPVDRNDFLKADGKYTVIAWRTEEATCSEAVVRLPLEELLAQLDPGQLVQVHCSAIVNLGSVSHVVRHTNETADIHLKGRPDVLRASRNVTHHFKRM